MKSPQQSKKKRLFLYTPIRFFWLGLFLFLGACHHYGPFVDAFQNMKHGFFGFPENPLKAADIAKLERGAIAIRLGKTPISLMHYRSSSNSYDTWIGDDKSVMITKNGILTQTAGPEFNLLGMDFLKSEPVLLNLYTLEGPVNIERTIDLNREKMNAIKMLSTLTPQGFEDVVIVEKTYKLKKIVEKVRVKTIHWSFNNVYWVDEHNHILKSVQHFHPEYPNLEITLVKEPRP